MAILFRIFFLVLFSTCFPLSAFPGTYEVGVGKTFENIGDVPWENMKPGDQVLIYWRQQPYKEKWVIAAQGTEQQPFVVRGVPNPYGELPVIDGREATTRSQINFWNEDRGVIKIGGANKPAVDEPTWIIFENLEIRSGRPPYPFTGWSGQQPDCPLRRGQQGYDHLSKRDSLFLQQYRSLHTHGEYYPAPPFNQ
jgi:hypothetical protein